MDYCHYGYLIMTAVHAADVAVVLVYLSPLQILSLLQMGVNFMMVTIMMVLVVRMEGCLVVVLFVLQTKPLLLECPITMTIPN